ncbi:MAG TPA: bifunctional tetrahydrofolate synthase/dihydrofolate synthase [Gammaproteobacteria bacterium]|nr:bifunctional tetrahydrofolate synthase/dihydrofolate synthase [Gammaproteobacteria bacterium]
MSPALQDWLLRLTKQHPKTIDMGLERVSLVADRFLLQGFPMPVITVAGTNGKGTCVAALEAIYLQQGYQVASYTSPHLVQFNERIRINRQPLSDDLLIDAFTHVEQARQGTSLTFFEFTTLAALWIFYHANVDVMLLEVGLGGRLDAVNVVDADVAVITSVGHDHMDYLGPDLDSIGREKAGIFRLRKPVVYGDDNPPTAVMKEVARLHTPLYLYGREFEIDSSGKQWMWRGIKADGEKLQIPLHTSQLNKSAIACAMQAAELLSAQLPVSSQALASGSIQRLAGRFSVISENPLQVLDVAHNKPAIAALFEKLYEDYPEAGEVHVLFAMLQNKDILGSIEQVKGNICAWHLVPLVDDRALGTSDLAHIIKAGDPDANIYCYQSALEAWHGAQRQSGDKPIIVFGSFVLIGDLMRELNLSVD